MNYSAIPVIFRNPPLVTVKPFSSLTLPADTFRLPPSSTEHAVFTAIHNIKCLKISANIDYLMWRIIKNKYGFQYGFKTVL
ncbi:MAG: hypothetical protein K2H47_03550, partial [Muribaculaceae bacterium]|nr:hypothetical protein [Muribaculaceae bacterium]